MPVEVLYGDSVLPDTPIIVMHKKQIKIIPITSLFPSTLTSLRYSPKGYMVLTDRGFIPLQYVYKHHVRKKCYRLKSRHGFVECTEDHSLIINHQLTSPVSLVLGDKITLVNFVSKSLVSISDDLAWLFGIFVAEGSCGFYHYSAGDKYAWALNNQNMAILNKAKSILYTHLGIRSEILNTMQSSNVYKLVIKDSIKLLVEYFRFHCYSHEYKIIPFCVLNGSTENKKSFLNGLFVGDGGIDKRTKIIEIGQNHKAVICGLTCILAELRYPFSIDIRADKPKHITIRLIRDPDDTRIQEPNRLTHIETFDYVGDVYDLSTKNHRFCGGIGNVLLHNTDSIFCHNPTDIQIKRVQQYVAEKYHMELEKDKEFKYIIFSGRKKNYLAFDQKGKPTIKGLTGRKSNVPLFIRNLFKSVIDHLSTLQSQEDFVTARQTLIERLRSELLALKHLSHPVEQYIYSVTAHKDASDYGGESDSGRSKPIPQHIRASPEVQAGERIDYIKTTRGPILASQFKPEDKRYIDVETYTEALVTTFSPLLEVMDLPWDLIETGSRDGDLGAWT